MVVAKEPVRRLLWVSVLLLTSIPVNADDFVLGASDPWCQRFNAARPGDRLLLSSGDYFGPCVMRQSGEPGKPITLASRSRERPARFHAPGSRVDVLQVEGARHVVIEGLFFSPTPPWADAIRINSGSHITILGNRFHGLGGQAVLAASRDTDYITIRDNDIRESYATAIYLGCHDGQQCRSSNALIENNVIDGVDAPDNQIGYGIQLKLNSTGIIRGNRIRRTKGPGIMVYGSESDLVESRVEDNEVSDSWASSGITLGGGPVTVTGNRSWFNAGAGIYAQNYKQRNLQRGVHIRDNDVWENLGGEIVMESWAPNTNNTLMNNRMASVFKNPAGPLASLPGQIEGNVLCGPAQCCVPEIGARRH